MFKQLFLSSTTFSRKHTGQIQVKTKYSGDMGTQRENSRSLKHLWESKVHCNVDSILTQGTVEY